MEYLVHQILDKASADDLCNILINAEEQYWQDGKKTSGAHASKFKNNLQLNRDCPLSEVLSKQITDKIRKEEIIKSFCLPRKIHSLIFTRTGHGQGYGAHVDNAYMSTGRSDLSFTLFLNGPEDYE